MRVPIEWLREYVAVPDDKIDEYADVLTMAGLEVEETLKDPSGPVWFTKITPNRGDWASIYGTARELAAALSLPLTASGSPVPPNGGKDGGGGGTLSIDIQDTEGCGRFQGIVIDGVTIGPAPEWLQARLRAALGDRYRPINNVADITNYVMLALGQPLHAFDLDTIPEGKIVVRSAKAGEKLVTLDGEERDLPEGVLCICDFEKPISIAGIMGGLPTEITAGTTRVMLETAHFDPLRVRRGAKKTLRSEASYRFERYVDPELVKVAGELAAKLICEIAGGQIVDIEENIARPTPRIRVLARMDRVRKLLGADVDRDAAISALERLGIEVTRSAGAMDCGIPSWRPDLTIEDDIAEEVGRLALGYANLEEKVAWQIGQRGQDSPRSVFLRRVKDAMVRAGLQEVVSHSLVAEGQLALRNPMAPEYGHLRDSLLVNLLAIAGRANREGLKDLGLFEVGPVYLPAENDGIKEPLRVSGLVAGSGLGGVWGARGDAYPADFYFVKGIVETLLGALGISAVTFEPTTHSLLHPYRAASVLVGSVELGTLGELSEATTSSHDVARRACVFDLDGDVLTQLATGTTASAKAMPRYPAVVRDLAPVFSKDVAFAAMEEVAKGAAGENLESLRLTDVYEGTGVAEGSRSLTLRFTFRSASGTLTDAEVEGALQEVRAALTRLGGELRS
ncbi:MAG: phenylalanine--tRNA ligase subunit beta [Armatimonas sp.]